MSQFGDPNSSQVWDRIEYLLSQLLENGFGNGGGDGGGSGGGSIDVSTLAKETTLQQLKTILQGELNVDVTIPSTQTVNGTVAVSNLPSTQPVSGIVSVSNLPSTQIVSGTVAISNLPATQPISGSVNVGNFPTGFNVNNFPGSFEISNFPSSFGVNNFPSTFAATQSGVWSVGVNNFPSSFNVGNFPSSFNVGNFPSTFSAVQSGTWSVGLAAGANTIGAISNTSFASTQSGSWNVGVNNFPSTFAATQSGVWSVAVSNLPATQPISAASLPLPTGAATESTLSTLNGKFASLGRKTMDGSVPVVISSDQGTVPINPFVVALSEANLGSSGDYSYTNAFADNRGRMYVSPISPTTSYSAIGTATAGLISSTSRNLFSISASNQNASTRWLQLFDRSTALSGGETPIRSYPVYGGGGLTIIDQTTFGSRGLNFSTGIYWAMSTTALTYTAATASETIVDARYGS